MSALLAVPPLSLAKAWGELVECYHGVHRWGGDIGEIYMFRLLGRGAGEAMTDEDAAAAGKALHELLSLFEKEYDCSITIGRRVLGPWLRKGVPHRVHVHVIPRDETRDPSRTAIEGVAA